MPDSSNSRPKRRWFQFGLRTFLVIVVVVGCVGSWLGSHVNRARQEEEAVRRLQSVEDGRSFNMLFVDPFKAVDGRGEMAMFYKGGPQWLTRMFGADIFRAVKTLQVYGPGNSFSYQLDADGQLEIQRQYNSGIKDNELASIAKLRYLDFLALEANGVSDITPLAELSRLETLNLSNAAITDDAAEVITALPKLRDLNISRTHVSDRMVDSLASCRKLDRLNIEITRITPAGVKRLQRALPNCEIVH